MSRLLILHGQWYLNNPQRPCDGACAATHRPPATDGYDTLASVVHGGFTTGRRILRVALVHIPDRVQFTDDFQFFRARFLGIDSPLAEMRLRDNLTDRVTHAEELDHVDFARG